MTGYAGGKMLAAIENGIGLVTFNQPEKRNAMSLEMWQGFQEILDAFASDDAVRVVILTGAGDKAFVSGADISQFEKQRSDAEARADYDRHVAAGRARLAAFEKPVIARIRGFCMGGGLDIAMHSDLRVAGDDAVFSVPAARLGIGFGWDVTRRLVSLVGPAHAKALIYTAGRIDANEAQRIGLVNRVVLTEELTNTVLEIARAIAENAPLSVRAGKIAVNEAVKDGGERDVARARAAVATCFESADYREGRTAFMEKRPPRFVGR